MSERYDLDDFRAVAPFKGSVLVQPSTSRRAVYGAALLLGALLAIAGLIALLGTMSGARASETATLTVLISLLLIVAGAALLWRFSTPLTFAVDVSAAGLSWRNLFGWRHARWSDIEFVLVKAHNRFGGREVHVKSGNNRLHFGWTDPGDHLTPGPLESLPPDEGRALANSIVTRAGLQRREEGVWVRESDPPIEVSLGRFQV